jgi:hypothetical protein
VETGSGGRTEGRAGSSGVAAASGKGGMDFWLGLGSDGDWVRVGEECYGVGNGRGEGMG